MRTKKILSILLATIMALGVLGLSASPVELVGEDGAVVHADKGWHDVPNPFPIYDVSATRATGMDRAVIVWIPFTDENGNATAAETATTIGSFHWLSGQKFSNVSTERALCEWKAYKVAANGGMETNRGQYNVVRSSSYGSGAYYSIAANEVVLNLVQGDSNYYGWVRVELTVKVDTNKDGVVDDEKVATPIWVYLTEPKPLAEKINEAKKEAAKSDRYTKDYIDNLNRRVRNASELLTQKAEQALIDYHIDLLNKAIAGTDNKADGTPVGNKWKLTGWEWFDNLLGQGVIAFFWQAYDVVTTIIDTVKPLIDFFGQVGNFFGNIMPLFTMLFGFLPI